jgi:hypothetical protein
MEIYSFFYNGNWYQVGDFIKMGLFRNAWEIIHIIDGGSVVITRNGKYKRIEGKVRIS